MIEEINLNSINITIKISKGKFENLIFKLYLGGNRVLSYRVAVDHWYLTPFKNYLKWPTLFRAQVGTLKEFT